MSNSLHVSFMYTYKNKIKIKMKTLIIIYADKHPRTEVEIFSQRIILKHLVVVKYY